MITAKTESLLRSLFATDEDGKVYLRVTGGEAGSGELKNAVSSQSNRSLETLLSNAIVLDVDGNPAIRLASVVYGKTIKEANDERRAKMLADKEERLATTVEAEEIEEVEE